MRIGIDSASALRCSESSTIVGEPSAQQVFG
jgi:hypothetical protein